MQQFTYPTKTAWTIYSNSVLKYWESLKDIKDDNGIFLGNTLLYNKMVEQLKFTVFMIKFYQIGVLYADLVIRRTNITHIKLFNLFYEFITGEARVDIELFKQATINTGLIPVRSNLTIDNYEMDEVSLYVIGPFESKLINWINEYFVMFTHYIAAKQAIHYNSDNYRFNNDILVQQCTEQYGKYLAFMNTFRIMCYIKSVQSHPIFWAIHQYACIKSGINYGNLDEYLFYGLPPEKRSEIMKLANEQMQVVNLCTRNQVVTQYEEAMLSRNIIQCKKCLKWNVDRNDEQELCEDCFVEEKQNTCPNHTIEVGVQRLELDIKEKYNENKKAALRFIETNYENLRQGQFVTIAMNHDGAQVVKVFDDISNVLTERVGDPSFYYTEVRPIQNKHPGHRYRRLKVNIPNSNTNISLNQNNYSVKCAYCGSENAEGYINHNLEPNPYVCIPCDTKRANNNSMLVEEGFIVSDEYKDKESVEQIEQAWANFRQGKEELCKVCFTSESGYKLRSRCRCYIIQ